VPNEFVEAYFPLRVETYEFIVDSGGAGLHRGGNGLSVAYRFLVDGHIGIHDDRWLTYPWGVNGGKPGKRSTKLLVRADGSEEYIPAKCEGIKVHKGDLLYFNTWGGGGWGDPLQRDPTIVVSDVAKKLVSIEGAKRYGVVINEDLSLDQPKTDALRAKMSKDTVQDEMFNFGGTIEEIKARCLEETHLEPPVSPTFLNQ
jgi:N-methylhydantoinase B